MKNEKQTEANNSVRKKKFCPWEAYLHTI